ncbi:MAG: alpha/beta hydrolase [Saprospiraceae bacterium]|nr:alpha/beta hydrolase [Saprospiraceae bacterium]
MRLRFFFFLGLLLPFALAAQLTIEVNAIPANTPADAKMYLAGSFNNWNTSDPKALLAPLGAGRYTVTIYPPAGKLEYKVARGNWATVEGTAAGKFLANRSLQYDGKAQTIQISILGWEDRDSGGGGSAAPNVFVLDDHFNIPQLNRKRRIWVYLPPDYATTDKRYPVLYMHDAQNLFDNETSSFGEWQVDESLNRLFNQGDYGCIVVGIDNGGAKRLDEYSPWKNPEYGGGEGDEYMDFLTKTLKPKIDATYRTLPGRQTTGLMGSSMGGLISMYGFADWQQTFSRAGVLSPAFWFAGTGPVDDIRAHPKQGDARIYFLAGGEEPDYVEQDILNVSNALLSAGFAPGDIRLNVVADGQHSEWFWRREFPAAYQWLFAGTVPKVKKREVFGFDLKMEEKPAADGLARIAGVKTSERIQLRIVGADGKVWRSLKQKGNAVDTRELPKGEYTILVKKKGKDWEMGELVK